MEEDARLLVHCGYQRRQTNLQGRAGSQTGVLLVVVILQIRFFIFFFIETFELVVWTQQQLSLVTIRVKVLEHEKDHR